MTYSLSTYPGKPATTAVSTKLNLVGYTFSAEFSTLSTFASPVTAGTVTFSGGNVVLSLSSTEVDARKNCYYRIKATKAGNSLFIARGTITYVDTATTVTPDLFDADGYLKEAYFSPEDKGASVVIDGTEVEVLAIDSSPLTPSDVGLVGPAVIVPHSSMFNTPAYATWPNANNAIFQRFSVTAPRAYGFINIDIGTASGNMEVGIIRTSGTGLLNFTRVATSGVIAAVAGTRHIAISTAALTVGDYALYMWADNATITCRVTNNSGITASRLCGEQGPFASGVPASGTITTWAGSRYIGGTTLEVNV